MKDLTPEKSRYSSEDLTILNKIFPIILIAFAESLAKFINLLGVNKLENLSNLLMLPMDFHILQMHLRIKSENFTCNEVFNGVYII